MCVAWQQECDQSVATAMEAKLKEKQAMSLVSGLQADIEALQSQVRRIYIMWAAFNCRTKSARNSHV